jgi:hypothetical protein
LAKFQIADCWPKLGLILADHYQKNRQNYYGRFAYNRLPLVKKRYLDIGKKSKNRQ